MTASSNAPTTRPSARRIARKATVLTAVGGLLSAGIAMAAWNASNAGNGAGKSVARNVVRVDPGTVIADLYPGAKGDVVVSITNPNPYTVSLSSVVAGGAISSDAANCNAATAVTHTFSTLNLTGAIAAGGTYVLTIDNGIQMSNAATDECAAANFVVPVTINAASDPSATTSTSGTVVAS